MATDPGGGGTPPHLRDLLLSAARIRDPQSTRLARQLASDADAGDSLRTYGRRLAATTELFPRKLAALCSVVPHPDLRARLVANLAEEEGLGPDGAGLRADPAARHGAWARRFARAAGVTDAEVDEAIPDSGSPWFESSIRGGRWMAAFAYVTIGLEANGPPVFQALLPGLRRRGFTEDDLAFLVRHVVLDLGHAAIGLDLVCRYATDAAAVDEARAGARRGAREFLALHDTCVRGPAA